MNILKTPLPFIKVFFLLAVILDSILASDKMVDVSYSRQTPGVTYHDEPGEIPSNIFRQQQIYSEIKITNPHNRPVRLSLLTYNKVPMFFDLHGVQVFRKNHAPRGFEQLLKKLAIHHLEITHHRWVQSDHPLSLEEHWSGLGMGFCGQANSVFSEAFKEMGVESRAVPLLDNSHYVCEYKIGDRWAMVDFNRNMLPWDGNRIMDWEDALCDPQMVIMHGRGGLFLDPNGLPDRQMRALEYLYQRLRTPFVHNKDPEPPEPHRSASFTMTPTSSLKFLAKPIEPTGMLASYDVSFMDARHLRVGVYESESIGGGEFISPLPIINIEIRLKKPFDANESKRFRGLIRDKFFLYEQKDEKVISLKSLKFTKTFPMLSSVEIQSIRCEFVYNGRIFNFSAKRNVLEIPEELHADVKFRRRLKAVNPVDPPEIVVHNGHWLVRFKDSKYRRLTVYPEGKIDEYLLAHDKATEEKEVIIRRGYLKGNMELRVQVFDETFEISESGSFSLPSLKALPYYRELKDVDDGLRIFSSRNRLFNALDEPFQVSPPTEISHRSYSLSSIDQREVRKSIDIDPKHNYYKFFMGDIPVSRPFLTKGVFDEDALPPLDHIGLEWGPGQEYYYVTMRRNEVQWLKNRSFKEALSINLHFLWKVHKLKLALFSSLIFLLLFLKYYRIKLERKKG